MPASDFQHPRLLSRHTNPHISRSRARDHYLFLRCPASFNSSLHGAPLSIPRTRRASVVGPGKGSTATAPAPSRTSMQCARDDGAGHGIEHTGMWQSGCRQKHSPTSVQASVSVLPSRPPGGSPRALFPHLTFPARPSPPAPRRFPLTGPPRSTSSAHLSIPLLVSAARAYLARSRMSISERNAV
jgi:hypothetical protein